MTCLGTALILLCHSHALAASAYVLFDQLLGRVAAVEIVDGPERTVRSSGVIAARGSVVAQCDMVSGAKQIRLQIGNRHYRATIAEQDVQRNLCLLAVEGHDTEPPELAPAAGVVPGVRIYAVSNALGLGISMTEGVVSAVRRSNGLNAIQFTAAIAPGSEGGGLFDEAGRLVGIIRYRKLDGQNVNFAAPPHWIAEIPFRAANQNELRVASETALQFVRDGNWDDLAIHARARIASAADDATAWRWLATAASQKRDYKEALAAHTTVLKLDPEDLPASLGIGWSNIGLGQFEAAQQAARAALDLQRETAQPWLLLAYAEHALKRNEAARKALDEAIRLEPWNPVVLRIAAQLAREMGDLPAAIRRLREIALMVPDDITVLSELIDSYSLAKRYDRAVAIADRALRTDPKNGDVMLLRGRALHGMGRDQAAIEALKDGLASQPRQPAQGWYWLGSVYFALKLFPEAIAAYRQTLELQPSFILARQWLAIALRDYGMHGEALAQIEIVKREMPDHPWVWRHTGAVLTNEGRTAEAIPALERSLALDGKQAPVWRLLMYAYRIENRPVDSRRAYERLRELDPQEADFAYRDNGLMLSQPEGSRR